MKDDLKKPCNECPFRTSSLKGWLGGETPEDTFNHVVGEGDFACHMTRHKKEKDMSRCKGSMLFLRKMAKMPKFNRKLADALKKIDYQEAKESNILARNEFIKHHTL